ncbi:MAG: RDD family protein [Polyangiaceae bacterium]|nr:RDD family protein [Polyangiaceae bacterium]
MPPHETVNFQGMAICAQCKPLFFQRLQESGGARFGGGGVGLGSMSYADFGIRLLAKIVDTIILSVAQGMIQIPMMLAMPQQAASSPAEVFAVMTGALVPMGLSLVMQGAYYTFFIGKFGATAGKMLFKLRVVAPDGTALSYNAAFIRYLSELVTGCTCLIGYLICINDPERRTLHDRMASTRVVVRG